MTKTVLRVSPLAQNRRQRFEQVLGGLTLLPSTYTIPMKVLKMKRSATAGAVEFAAVIAAEPALAAKVLALANSAAYAPVAPVTRLSTAISMIGLNNLLPLIFGLSFAGIFNKLAVPPQEQAALWRASLLKAVTARQYVLTLFCAGRSAQENEVLAEEAFLGALFQDMALPLFYAADRSTWLEFAAMLESSDGLRRDREKAMYGIDHTEAGARCAKALGLPDLFVKSIFAHHDGPEALEGSWRAAAAALDAAASLPHRLTSLSSKPLQALWRRLQHASDVPPAELKKLVQTTVERLAEMERLFAEPQDANASFKQFLQSLSSEVVECLQSSISSSAAEINSLRQREQQVCAELLSLHEKVAQADRDPLTRALTRSAFIMRLSQLLTLAQDNRVPCAVGFIDMDDFKRVNDTHGHAVGDAALVQLVASLGEALKGRGIIGRLGGDEFVFALVSRGGGLDEDLGAFMAQASRLSFTHDGVCMELTTSIGIVSIGVPETTEAPERIINEADMLMYQAKRAGKGRAQVGKRAAEILSEISAL